MANKNLIGLLLGLIAVMAVSSSFAVATEDTPFGAISQVEVNGVSIDVSNPASIDISNLAGKTVPVFVRFDAQCLNWDYEGNCVEDTLAEDVVIRVWISGEREATVETEQFDVIAGKTYSRFLFVEMPANLDDLQETRRLEIEVESDDGNLGDDFSVALTVQRESHQFEILSVQMPSEAKAGELVPFDVVIKNRGRQLEEDAFLRVRIPELGVETKSFIGDLPAIDCDEDDVGCDEDDDEDAIERRVFLRIPSDAAPGLFTVEVQAFSDDVFADAERKLLVTGAEADSMVIASTKSKTFKVGEKVEYSFTIVNKGDVAQVYEVSLSNVPNELDVDLSQSTVAVSAGSSETITITVKASEKGNYNFNVGVHSESGATLSNLTYSAQVEGGKGINFGNNTTLLLTVVLAIVFIVLLVVLIVLLTRKSSNGEDKKGESSYY